MRDLPLDKPNLRRPRYVRPSRRVRVLRKTAEVSLFLTLLIVTHWLAWSWAETFPISRRGPGYAYAITTFAAIFTTFGSHDLIMTFVAPKRPRFHRNRKT